MPLGVYKNPQRLKKTYFEAYPGMYCVGDSAFRGQDSYYWIAGRTDNVINVSGHRLDTAEIESALIEHINSKKLG